jgi:trk system potassium uptake protein TrkH
MGIIMLGMMLLSRVMGGGMALARAELTGTSLSRLRPKIKQTALALWGLYVFLTLVEFFMLKFIGKLTYFDAINHALTTLPTGGFSTYDANIGHFDSVAVELIIILFMFLAGVNFTLLWMFRDGQGKKALRDEELRYYVFYILIALVIVLIALLLSGEYNGPDALRDSLFQVVSIATSTGYGSADYIPWPVATHIIIFMLMVIGASAGSTGGGLKLMRVILAFKVAMRELVRIAQPRRIDRIRMNGEVVERQQLGLIVGMLFVWIGLFGISTLILAILMPEHSFESIVSIVASSLGNTGPALGEFGPTNTWSGMNSWALILTSMLMWCGRLELLTAVILLHPRTWKKEEKDLTERSAVAMWRKMIPTKDEK